MHAYHTVHPSYIKMQKMYVIMLTINWKPNAYGEHT